MTTPTQAQVEAVRRVLAGLVVITGDSTWDMDYVARRVLTAAAQVGGQRHSVDFLEGIAEGKAATIERCAQELEAAYAECNTLNLLHGAARIRKLKDEP